MPSTLFSFVPSSSAPLLSVIDSFLVNLVSSLFLVYWRMPLFVFSIDDTKQNAGSLLTPVSSIVFGAPLHCTLSFAFHGCFNNHLFQRIWLAVAEFSPIRKWFKSLPWRGYHVKELQKLCHKQVFGANHRQNKQWCSCCDEMDQSENESIVS